MADRVDALLERLDAAGRVAVNRDLLNEAATVVRELRGRLDYFGSCHAATLEYDGKLSSMSHSRLQRLVSIGVAMLEHMTPNSTEAKRLLESIASAKKA